MKTKKLALCSMLSALGCALLLIGCVSDIFDLTFSCAASLIIVFAVIELKGPYPLLIYLVTGLVSLLILPVKFLAIIYLLFSGISTLHFLHFIKNTSKTLSILSIIILYIFNNIHFYFCH